MSRAACAILLLALALPLAGCADAKEVPPEVLSLVEESHRGDLGGEETSETWVVVAEPVASTGAGEDLVVYGWLFERSYAIRLSVPLAVRNARRGFVAKMDFVDKDVTGPSEWKLEDLAVESDPTAFLESLPEAVADEFAKAGEERADPVREFEVSRNELEPALSEYRERDPVKTGWTDLAVPAGADGPHSHGEGLGRRLSVAGAVEKVRLVPFDTGHSPDWGLMPEDAQGWGMDMEDGNIVVMGKGEVFRVAGLGGLQPSEPEFVTLDDLAGESETPTSSYLDVRKVGETTMLVFDAVGDRDTFGDGEDTGLHIAFDLDRGRVLWAVPYGPLAFAKDRD